MFASSSQNQDFPSVDYSLHFSLKSLALVKVATVLFDRLGVKIDAWEFLLVSDGFLYERRKKWLPIEEDAISKAKTLPLPTSLKTELAFYCSAASWELFLWLDFHVNKHAIIQKMPDTFVWTAQGTIDRKETAQLLVKDTRLDIVKRYKLACLYCLENDIVELWNQLYVGKDFKKTLRSKNLDTNPLVSYWSHHVAGKLEELRPTMIDLCGPGDFTPCEYAFRISADMEDEVAFRYFLEKLNTEEKDWLPLDVVKYLQEEPHFFYVSDDDSEDYLAKKHTGILYFSLLQVFDERKQGALFYSDPYFVIVRFLDWPLQSLFLKVAEKWSSYLNETTCYYLLEAIATRAHVGCKDYDYQELYGQFWHSISPSYKKNIIQEGMDEAFLLHLFILGDWKNISLLFKEMSTEDREDFIFSEDGEDLCKRLIYYYHFEVLKLFILLCISSRKKASKFRKMLVMWQMEEEEDNNSSNDDDDEYVDEKDRMIPGEAYCLLGYAIEAMDELLAENYKKRKCKDAHKSIKKSPTKGTKNDV